MPETPPWICRIVEKQRGIRALDLNQRIVTCYVRSPTFNLGGVATWFYPGSCSAHAFNGRTVEFNYKWFLVILMSGTKSRKRASAEKETEQPVEDGFLCGVNVVIVEQKLGRARADILDKQLTRNGGKRHKQLQSDTTHVLIDNNLTYNKTLSLLKATECGISSDVLVVRADWLSSCLSNGRVIDCKPFEVTKTLEAKEIHQKTRDLQVDAGARPEEVSDKGGSSTDTSPVKSQSGLSSSNTTPEKTHEGRSLYGWGQNPRKRLMDILDDDSDYIDSGSDNDGLAEIGVTANSSAVGDSVVRNEDVTASAPSRKKLVYRLEICFKFVISVTSI